VACGVGGCPPAHGVATATTEYSRTVPRGVPTAISTADTRQRRIAQGIADGAHIAI